MQEHVYNICDKLSVLGLKACKRRITPTTHTERRTSRSTHTPLTEHRKRSSLERMRSKRRRRAAAVYPPPCLSIERSPAKRSNPPPHPRLPPNSMKPPPAGHPPLVVRANLVRPVLALRLRAISATCPSIRHRCRLRSAATGRAPSRSILLLLLQLRMARCQARVHSGRKSAHRAQGALRAADVCLPRRPWPSGSRQHALHAARAPSRPLPCRRSRQGPEADRQPAWPRVPDCLS